jgi:CubicO group peptidase (beta-lactamase class C family)
VTRFSDTYAGRIVQWGLPSSHDDRRFAIRDVARSPHPVELPAAEWPSEVAVGEHTVGRARISPVNLEDFLTRNGTTSFLVVQNGTLVYERYFDGAGTDVPHAAFSVTKSFLGALIGIALERGLFESIHDPIVRYVSELETLGYARVRLEHLLSMSEGLRYSRLPVPWSGDARAYYAPDRWAALLANSRLIHPPGRVWNYNDYAPTILGVALQRVTGQNLTEFAKAALLDPLGMPHRAHWTLDSADAGLENAAAGLYISSRTLAAFGQAHLDGGCVAGRQVIPSEWVKSATTISPTDGREIRRAQAAFFSLKRVAYKYLWWVIERANAPSDFAAIGNLGQFVYCSPAAGTVVVRTGRKWGRFGRSNWLTLFESMANADRLLPRTP